MWLRILGLPDDAGQWWGVENLAPADGTALDRLLRDRLPGYRFCVHGTPLADHSAADLASALPLTLVARPAGRPAPTGRGPGPEILVVTEAGPDAGRLAPLSRSGFTVGRNLADVRIADPFLSAPHFRAVVGPDGIRIDPLTGTGDRSTGADTARASWTGDEPLEAGSSAFGLFRGRPDPLPPLGPPPSLTVDPGPEPTRPNALLQVIMAAGPLVIGVVMAVVTGLWYFLLFSLVSVGVAGVMLAQHRTARTRHGRRIRQEVDALAGRLEAVAPDPGRLSLAARSAVTDRFGTGGIGTAAPAVRWGTGTVAVPVAREQTTRDWTAWSSASLPVVSELRAGEATLLTGQRSTLDAVARWLIVQLCRDAAASGRGVLVRTVGGDSWPSGNPSTPEGTAILHPGASSRGLPDRWHHVVLRGTASTDETRWAGDELAPDAGRASVTGLEYAGFRWDGMSTATAEWLQDELGATPRPPVATQSQPLEVPEPAMSSPAVDSLRCLLAAGDEPVEFDAVRDGPHALVAGTTGSGKSELLLTVLTGMAADHRPAEVSFVLMDFKGGSSFAPLARLPHTMSVETNLVEAESLRTFDALTAELRRREELFLAAGSADFQAYRRSHPDAVLPRLVVAIDELRVLVEDHPQAAAVLARLAATGRSLGFHLLLATQRAQGAVSPDVRSNMGTVVCLRTATEQESWDLLGSPVAFSIDADAPGRAYIKHGGATARQFQTGRFAVPAGPPELHPWRGETAPPAQSATWPALVRRLRDDAGARGLAVPEPVVMPALPEHWSPTPADRLAARGAVVVGLADLPRYRRREPVHWRPGQDAPAAWIGTEAGGLDEVIRSVVGQLAHAPVASPQPLTLVLDGGRIGGFAPGTGTVPSARAATASPDAISGSTIAQDTGSEDTGSDGDWSVLSPDHATPERLATTLERVRDALGNHHPVRLVVCSWGQWAQRRVGTSYETFEEHLAVLIRDHPPAQLAVALFGSRDLAGSRVLGQVPTRFYVPAGSTPEQRMVWPTLQRIREVPGRAIMVTPDRPAPGVAVQLLSEPPAAEPSAG